jgi:acyl-CoA dehydrogenase
MDLRFSRELEAFRDEVRAFLDGALDDELRRGAAYNGGMFQDYETNIRWHRILAAKGWVAPAWPERFGGPGWSVEQRYIFSAECAAAGAPALAPMGLGMCGPVLMGHGTEEQQATFLPRILSGEDYWCQGYSEPGSGSDLAALALDARRDGDHYVLNGSKIWTTHAHHANWMFALVRTDRSGKPQTGITFLLIPMDTPGLRVDPIIFVSGEHEVNAVFFDDVRVPVSHRVGAENDGWTVAKYLLEFERGGGNAGPGLEAAAQRLHRLAADHGVALPEGTLATLEVTMEAVKTLEFRILSALGQGQNPGPESSMLKTLAGQARQQLSELTVSLLGPTALGGAAAPAPREASPEVAAASATAAARYFNYRALSIAGGTDEVQRDIIAKRVLGL